MPRLACQKGRHRMLSIHVYSEVSPSKFNGIHALERGVKCQEGLQNGRCQEGLQNGPPHRDGRQPLQRCWCPGQPTSAPTAMALLS